MKWSKQKARNLFIICIVTVLTGQFYLSPVHFGFRLSLAVFFMALFLLYFEDYNVMIVTSLIAFFMFLFRASVAYVGDGLTFYDAANYYFPVVSFYIFYGILFEFLGVRDYLDKPFNFVMSLWVCDALPNIIEASIRRVWTIGAFDKVIVSIIIIGGIRSILTLLCYYIGKYYMGRFKRNERDKYYRELIVFISRLRTELFLLKKSRNDIEKMVSYVHGYYNRIEEEVLKAPLLKIAKDMHEIKKDYLRVIAGMDSIFDTKRSAHYMSIKDILHMTKDNMMKVIESMDKKITVTTAYDEIFTTNEYYTVVSILNNLTINSIEAIDIYGKIEIMVKICDENVLFTVEDDGEGIQKEKLEIIFSKGYSTKYDEKTGQMSTGIGLSHVKELVTGYLQGEISVESEINKGTKISIRIPKKRMIGGMGNDEFHLYR
ncbi:ATP-binding protein [Marinisporobacter balticus]|uniref:histidine kinase n=1 Tax=Marinisporobacter balticus TaxID=2018667 RepID=A0A4R2K9D2_9FIRM|nr:ATP-binding protein [Marinisporobacter balticus]TCO70011.1 two-component system sensor histidine kinase YcbA [Marinisporobacter balticus]